jgi:hypothetical protein
MDIWLLDICGVIGIWLLDICGFIVKQLKAVRDRI